MLSFCYNARIWQTDRRTDRCSSQYLTCSTVNSAVFWLTWYITDSHIHSLSYICWNFGAYSIIFLGDIVESKGRCFLLKHFVYVQKFYSTELFVTVCVVGVWILSEADCNAVSTCGGHWRQPIHTNKRRTRGFPQESLWLGHRTRQRHTAGMWPIYCAHLTWLYCTVQKAFQYETV